MRLADLNPRWFAEDGRQGQGITFDCPCGCKGTPRAARLGVAFFPALDGGAPIDVNKFEPLMKAMTDPDGRPPYDTAPPAVLWGRVGDTFETLTLIPSVDASASGHWHGHVRAGEVT
jgi:hypothetical protein